MNSNTSIAALIKDGAFGLAGLQIFEGLHRLSIGLQLSTFLESKAMVAVITGFFLVAARLVEARYSNSWRQRALEAEGKLNARGNRESNPAV